ncbi:MAG TPA: PP2C family protein-serine/threonine phosphatase [Thermoanaerobaculia bacterium]|nr:PP2C family protein-serine/threonine phosphatase [Thermoanaerobaculia bacterium]
MSGFYAVAEWPGGSPPATIFIGMVIGVFIHAFIYGFETLFGPTIDRFGGTVRAVGHALIFVAGGVLGGVLGLTAGVNLVGHSMNVFDVFRGRGQFFIIMAAATALIAASGFRAYDLLRDRLLQQLEERAGAEKELELARSIQNRLLPPSRIDGDGFTVSARNLPARFVAGDFYDVLRLDDGSVVIVVADVAGKGIGAALIMASVKAVLPFVARERPQQAMSMLNEKLVQELAKREFVALAYARLTPSDGALEVLNAGFPEPYVVSGGGVRALATSGERLPLGVRAGVRYEPLRTTLERGERLVFLSDGIPEAPVKGEPLGYDRVSQMLGRTNDLDAFLDLVRTAGGTVEDDWTAVMVART